MKLIIDKLGQSDEYSIKELGKCPHCDNEGYERHFSEVVMNYCTFDCECHSCEERFSEYFSLDETTWDDEEENEWFLTSTFGDDEKETLIRALNLLIEKEGDVKNYSEILGKLKGELKPYN